MISVNGLMDGMDLFYVDKKHQEIWVVSVLFMFPFVYFEIKSIKNFMHTENSSLLSGLVSLCVSVFTLESWLQL